jgi:hypothetical protein
MSEPWITLTRDHLLASLTESERERFGKASMPPGDDRIIEILSNLTKEIRGYIGSWAQNETLSQDATQIPPEFKRNALSIARWDLLSSIPGYQPGEARKLSYEKAEAFFAKVAEGKIRPAPAPDAIANTVPEEQRQPGVQIVASQPKRTGRQNMNGL